MPVVNLKIRKTGFFKQIFNFIFRVILGIIFIYASYDKILDPSGFSRNIHNFHVTPIAVENLAALIIPWIELIIGVFLIFGLFLGFLLKNQSK